MTKLAWSIFLLAGLSLLAMKPADACSVAFYTGSTEQGSELHLTGRTADLTSEFFTVDNHITISPRGVARDGNSGDGSIANPVTWVSKYGSLVFDDFVDGFNEKGLFVHPLYLDKSVYPSAGGTTPCISNLKVTSYLLDNAATVSECLALLDGVIVLPEKFQDFDFPIHWAIRDSSNDVAFVEYVNAGTKRHPKSKKVVYRGSEYDVLTNEPYLGKQLKYYKGFSKGNRALPGDFNAMGRFTRLKMFKKTPPSEQMSGKTSPISSR